MVRLQSLPVKLRNTATARRHPQAGDLKEIAALVSSIKDPEIPALTIGDLGILRDIQLCDDRVQVTITPTYSGCPAMHGIEQDIRSIVEGIGFAVVVKTSLSPAWTTDWLTDAGRARLRACGIAPPIRTAGNTPAPPGEETQVPCPYCESANTRKLSEFGSTACKALFTCEDCLQPFDYFKWL